MSFLPPGVVSGNLAAFPQIHYNQIPVMEWQANTPYIIEATDPRPVPKRVGRTVQLYGQKPFAAATNKLSEGIPGPSLNLSQVTSQGFLDEYGDWMGVSNVAESMFISPIVTDMTRNLSYRGALTANLVAVAAFDAAATADATSRIDLGDNEFFTGNILKRAATSLENNNVPTRGGNYTTIMSSLISYDLLADNSAGSPVDVWKRSPEGQSALEAGTNKSYQVGEWAGCRIIRTSTAPTYANYPSASKTGYGTIVVGKEAMFSSELMGTNVPKDPNYKVRVKYETDISLPNPMLQTAALVSYDFFLAVYPRPNTNGTAGFRRIRSEASIV